MKKLGLFLVALLNIAVLTYAQGGCEVVRSDYNRLVVSFTTSSNLSSETVVLKGRNFSLVTLDGFDHSSAIGVPSLPTLRKLVEIPLCERVVVRIVDERHVELDGTQFSCDHTVLPVQPPVCKTASRNADTLAFNQAVYSRNAFFGAEVVTVEPVGVARDRNLAEVVFSPVKYNPVTNRFLLYTQVEVELTYVDADIAATEEMRRLHGSPLFDHTCATINKLGGDESKNTTLYGDAPMRYLIVAHSMFRGKFDDFVEWKRRTGYIVDVAYTDDAAVGTTQVSIKNYVKSQYTNATADNPAPTYLLLIGDVQQIPAISYSYSGTSHVSDLDYALWTAGDNIPDCYYGRFSAQDVSQLTPQIEKTLLYERYEFPDPSFLDRALLVAGQDYGNSGDYGYSHADPAMDYAAKFYVNGDSKTVLGQSGFYKYSTVTEYKNNTSINMNATNVTVKSNSLDSEIRTKYSDGAGWINYSAHGNEDRWYNPQFTSVHVQLMSNIKKCGIMIGNCCLTGKFDMSTCFAEALLRKDDYCGAVAYIGASNSTYWNEDVYWAMGIRSSISGSMTQQYNSSNTGVYDQLFHTHGEAVGLWAPSLGSMMMCGNMSVQNSSSSRKNYYWQIYHVFGDPSLMPWLSQAKVMQLEHDGIGVGCTSFTATAAPYAYIALTDSNANLIGAAHANADGVATIRCRSEVSQGGYVLAATAQNYQPKLLELTVTDSSVVSETSVHNDVTAVVRCSPVPANGSVSFTVEGAEGSVQYDIVDISGRIVYTGSADSCVSPHKVDVTQLVSGTYIVRAVGSGFSAAGKFVVAK